MWWYNEYSKQFLKSYLDENQTLEERFDEIHSVMCKYKTKHYADRLIFHLKEGNMSLSTPIWCNFGNNKGLPISCYNTHVNDSIESILKALAEVGMMSKQGGGTSGGFSSVRARGSKISKGGKSHGPVSFLPAFQEVKNIISQGNQRRGEFAPYLSVEHADIMEYLTIRDETSKIQDLPFGITVTNSFFEKCKQGDIKSQKIWAAVIESRFNKGFPYIINLDNMNDSLEPWYKNKYEIKSSNICTEIQPTSNDEESFTCCLASPNIYRYDHWKDTDLIEVMTVMLDAVYDDFIEKASKIPFMDRAVKYAIRHRSIGIGWLGWHSYLQSKMIPIESMEAKQYCTIISKQIKEQAQKASREQALLYGEPEVMKGYGYRNAYLTAIAPTKSTAFILGQVSEGIEPYTTNYYIKDLAKIKVTVKNPELIKLLDSKGQNTDEVWDFIAKNNGSVQTLDILNDHEKKVFKTFMEISQKELIIQASIRQKYIDQAQSLNLMIHPDVSADDYNELIMFGMEQGIKSYYYHISISAAQTFTQNLLNCESCGA